MTAPTTFEAALRFLADHPDPAAVVPCIMPDGSQGWMPRPVADLVEAMPAAPAARLRRTLGKQGDGATPVWAAWLSDQTRPRDAEDWQMLRRLVKLTLPPA